MSDESKLSRRALLALGGAAAAGSVVGSQTDDALGNLYGGTMALDEAYNVSGDLWIGPDSARDQVESNSGRVYIATDSQIEYYGTGSSWEKMGVGSDSNPVPDVNTEALSAERTQSVEPLVQSGPRGFALQNLENRSQTQYQRRSNYQKPTFMWEMDDARQSVYDNRDVFSDLGITAHVSINPDNVGNDINGVPVMSWSQIKDLQDNLGWEMGNHGFRHDSFNDLEPDAIEEEIVEAIKALNENGVPHQHYTHSFGDTGGDIGKDILSELYPVGWSTTGTELADWEPYEAHRRKADGGVDISILEQAVDNAVSNNTGLILYGHDVIIGDTADEGSLEISSGKIQHITQYARDQGMEVVDRKNEVLRYSEAPVDDSPTLARAYLGATQTIPHDTFEIIEFDDVQEDDWGTWDTTNNAFVIDESGKYNITAHVTHDASTTGDEIFVRILQNGGNRSGTMRSATVGQELTVNFSITEPFAAGDEIQVSTLQRTGANQDIRSGVSTRLEIIKVDE